MRVYVDTNVFGSLFYIGHFNVAGNELFRRVRRGHYTLVISEVVEREILAGAPPDVQRFFYIMVPYADVLPLTPDVAALGLAYLAAGVVPPSQAADALHVAFATLGNCDVVASWDEQHIVRPSRIAAYNQVNYQRGEPIIEFYRPDDFLRKYQ